MSVLTHTPSERRRKKGSIPRGFAPLKSEHARTVLNTIGALPHGHLFPTRIESAPLAGRVRDHLGEDEKKLGTDTLCT